MGGAEGHRHLSEELKRLKLERPEITEANVLRQLQLMHSKGLLTRDEGQRPQVYAAAHAQHKLQQQLLKDIWGPTHTEDSHYLRIVVGHLRQKLADDPTRPRFIVTEAGVGYRLLGQG